MSKLYTATLEYDFVIEVDGGEVPEAVAEDVLRDVMSDLNTYDVDLNVREMKSIPAGWDGQCFPYRSDGETRLRISEVMEESQ